MKVFYASLMCALVLFESRLYSIGGLSAPMLFFNFALGLEVILKRS